MTTSGGNQLSSEYSIVVGTVAHDGRNRWQIRTLATVVGVLLQHHFHLHVDTEVTIQ